ncbi:MAG: hypothetical protein ABIM89_17125, partial [Mycobacteriales bacterium]
MTRGFSKTTRTLVAATAALALTAMACGKDKDDPKPGASGTSAAGSATSAAATSAAASGASSGATPAVAEGDVCEELKQFGDIKGKNISLYTSILAPE